MSKIAVIGDIHFARRAEHPTIKSHIKNGQKKFLESLPEIFKKNEVEQVWITGDLHDTRSSVNIEALNYTEYFLGEVLGDFEKHIIVGNHDLYYENSYEVSSLALFKRVPKTHLYLNTAAKVDVMGYNWYAIPWIIPEYIPQFIKFTEKLAGRPKAEREKTVLFGHFETMGIDMEGGNISTSGLDGNLLMNAAGLTVSGHYHGTSDNDNGNGRLLYAGSPFPLTFANSDADHGIWLIDDKLNTEFIKNDLSPKFTTIWDKDSLDELPDLSNSFVRFYFDRTRDPNDLMEARLKLEAKKPLFIAAIPYKEATQATTVSEDQRKANEVLNMDLMKLSDLYVNHNSDELPELQYYSDTKVEIMKRIENHMEEIQK